MLPAISFYAFLFLALFVLPAILILCTLFFFEYQRKVWHGESPGAQFIARLWAKSRVATGVEARFPKTVGFFRRRADPRTPWGLQATVAALVILAGAWFFLGVLEDISSRDPLVILDTRLHNAVPLFRTDRMTRSMLIWTELGGAIVLTLLCLGVVLKALANRHRRLGVAFVLALVGTSLVSATLKALFGTARPLEAIIHAQQNSFPSGHMLSGTVIYGLLAATLLASRAGNALRAVGVTLLLLLIVGIGLSRLYLGVHWPSDLLASLALALIVLSVLLFFLHYAPPIRWVDSFPLPQRIGVMQTAGNSLLALALVAAVGLSNQAKIFPVEPPEPTDAVAIEELRVALPAGMARWSEDLLGGRMEPISFVLVGSEKDILGAFDRAGWQRADLPTPVRVLQEGLAALLDRPDPKGPATPAFLNDRPQRVTFEKNAEVTPSIRQRHHTRLWQTQYCVAPSCRPVWVATASFDVGIQLSEGLHLPTHRIDGALDNERAHIAADLVNAGATSVGSISVTPPMNGKNAAGDQFWTDGRALVLVIP